MILGALLSFSLILGNSRGLSSDAFRIEVFDRINLEGKSFTYTSYQPDLRTSGFDNKACSLRMKGIWILYDNLDYNAKARGMSFFSWGQDYEVTNLKEMNYRASSLRSAGIGLLERPSLNLYKVSGFGGTEVYHGHDFPFLMEEGMSFESIILTGCRPWTLYSEKFYEGDRICIYPGDEERCYPGFFPRNKDFGYFGSRIKSGRIGCYSDVVVDTLEVLPNTLFSIDADLLKLISNQTMEGSVAL